MRATARLRKIAPVGRSIGIRYFHMVDKPCTELPNPEAAVLPALVSVFDSEVTSLGPMTRSAWVCAVFRQAILSSHACMTDFPPTKPEARGTNPTQIFTVRHRLFKVLLASALLRIRLRLSWLSFSRSSFWLDTRGCQPRCRLSPDNSSPRQPR